MNAAAKITGKEVANAERLYDQVELTRMTEAQILELIRQSPIPAQMLRDVRAAQRNRRRELVAVRDRELAFQDRGDPALMRRHREATDLVATKERELEAARRAEVALAREHQAHDYGHRHALSTAEMELERLAPPAIARFQDSMQAAWELHRHEGCVPELPRRDAFGRYFENEPQRIAAERDDRLLDLESYLVAAGAAQKLVYSDLDGLQLDDALAEILANKLELARKARLQAKERGRV